jgi:hypothetical protein
MTRPARQVTMSCGMRRDAIDRPAALEQRHAAKRAAECWQTGLLAGWRAVWRSEKVLQMTGSGGRTRTCDTRIMIPLL